MTAIAGALVGKLVGTGLGRLGSLAFQKVMRLHKVDQAIRGLTTRNQLVQKTLNDFETVIGSYHGTLTTKLHDFLGELEKTGIINSMVENALVGRKHAAIETAFLDLYQAVVGTEKKGRDLYDNLMASFTITLQELCKDKVVSAIVLASHKDISSRLDRIDAALARVGPQAEPTDFSTLKPIIIKIARSLQISLRNIRIETNKGARQVDITRIFIASKLAYRETKQNERTLATAQRALEFASVGRRSERQLLLEPLREHADQLTPISYSDLKGMFRRTVILGDPGGGKSTLCQRLCYEFARQSMLVFQHGEHSQIDAPVQKVPFRIILRAFEKARATQPQLSIHRYLLGEITNHANISESEAELALRYLITTGRAVFAFDGLDEILDTSQRRDFVDLVVSFSNSYPLCPVIVTSRLVGYDAASLPDEFEELVLEKFDRTEVLEYTTKFMKVIAGEKSDVAGKKANKFFQQTETNAHDLRRNPLMLGLMCWLFYLRDDVPSNRPEIYRECAVLMFERWDKDRGIVPQIPGNFDRLELFSELAYQIYGQRELAAGVEGPWLEKRVRSFFEKLYEDRARAIEATKSLIKFVTERAWVMSEVGEKVFAFTHQTFLEYFFAKHIDDSCDTVEEIFSVIEPKIIKSEWDVVAHLSLQLKTYKNLRRQEEALRRLQTILKGATDPDEVAAFLSFSSSSLEYLAGTESLVRSLVEIVIEKSFSRVEKGAKDSFTDLVKCLDSARERANIVKDAIVRGLGECLRSENLMRVELVASGLSADSEIPRSIGPALALGNLPVELRREVRADAKDYISKRAEVSREYASIAWRWYGVIDEKSVSKFGVATYYNSSIPEGVPVDGLTAMVLCASKDFNAVHYRLSGVSRQEALKGLRVIAKCGFQNYPFEKGKFVDLEGSPLVPFDIYTDCMKEFGKNPEEVAGVIFALLIRLEVVPELLEVSRRRRRNQRAFDDGSALEDAVRGAVEAQLNDRMRQLPYFDRMMNVVTGEGRLVY